MENKKIRFLLLLLIDLIVGILIGSLIGIYLIGIRYISDLSSFLYNNKHLLIICSVIFIVLIGMFINYFLIKKYPAIDGSGTPNLLIAIRKKEKIDWLYEIPALIINSYISTFAGFPLGSEGPCLVLAGKITKMSQDLFKEKNMDEDEMALGIGAGFGAAYISPLAGIFYTFETGLKRFSFKLLIRGIVITISSSLMVYVLDHHQILALHDFQMPNFSHLYILFFLMVLNVPTSFITYHALLFFKKIFYKFSKNKIVKYRAFVFFPIIIVLNLFFFDFLGSGVNIVEMDFSHLSMLAIFGILIFRIFITAICGAGGVTGGLVIPIMAIGALTGEIASKFLTLTFNLAPEYYSLVILISMAMVLAMINNIPFTASCLVFTTIFNYNMDILDAFILLPFIFVTIYLSTTILKVFNSTNFYEKAIELSLKYHH